MRIVSAKANSVRAALACARRVAGLKLADSRELTRSGGEGGLYRCTLAEGTVVEVTIAPRSKSEAFIQAE